MRTLQQIVANLVRAKPAALDRAMK